MFNIKKRIEDSEYPIEQTFSAEQPFFSSNLPLDQSFIDREVDENGEPIEYNVTTTESRNSAGYTQNIEVNSERKYPDQKTGNFDRVSIRYFNKSGLTSSNGFNSLITSSTDLEQEFQNIMDFLKRLEGKNLSTYVIRELTRARDIINEVLNEKLKQNTFPLRIGEREYKTVTAERRKIFLILNKNDPKRYELAECAQKLRNAFNAIVDLNAVEEEINKLNDNTVVQMRRVANG